MILEQETFEAFGYYPSDLTHGSDKYIIATCELCGKFRIIDNNMYRTFCNSCSQRLGRKQKGNIHALGHKHTEETKALISAASKGNTNLLGYTYSDKQRKAMSAAKKGTYLGEDNWNYKDGKKASWARNHAKRKQQLGYTLLMPLKDGEVGHHVTDEFVIGIPADVHNSIGGKRRKHRTKVLQWLKVNDKKKYEIVLNILKTEL